MSYLTQSQLETDPDFQGRSRAVLTQQSDQYINDTRGDIKATAAAVLQNDGPVQATFGRMLPAAPGFADKVDNGDGTINQDAITDADLLATVQAIFPTVAALYFTSDGQPIAA